MTLLGRPSRSLAARWRTLARRPRPLPPVDVAMRAWVPGWALRVAAVVLVPATVLLGAARTDVLPGVGVATALALGAWVAVRPGPGPAHVAVVVTAVLLLGSGDAPFDPAALWLAPLGYAAVRLGWWSAQAAPRSRVELDLLRHAAGRDLVVLGATVALGLGARALAGSPVEALVALGVVGLAGLAWLVVRLHDGR